MMTLKLLSGFQVIAYCDLPGCFGMSTRDFDMETDPKSVKLPDDWTRHPGLVVLITDGVGTNYAHALKIYCPRHKVIDVTVDGEVTAGA